MILKNLYKFYIVIIYNFTIIIKKLMIKYNFNKFIFIIFIILLLRIFT